MIKSDVDKRCRTSDPSGKSKMLFLSNVISCSITVSDAIDADDDCADLDGIFSKMVSICVISVV